jgi:hypothetical protein
VFVFLFAGFVKQIACSMLEAVKTLDTVEDLRPSMHAKITHSQADVAHNCATGMAVDLFFGEMVEARWCGGELTCRKPSRSGDSLPPHSAVIPA